MITQPGCGFITFPRDWVSLTHSLKPQSIINPQSESCQHSSGQSRGPEAAGVQTARTPTFILILMFMLRHMKYCCLISTSPNIATQIIHMSYFRNKTLKRKMKGKHWPGSTLEEWQQMWTCNPGRRSPVLHTSALSSGENLICNYFYVLGPDSGHPGTVTADSWVLSDSW